MKKTLLTYLLSAIILAPAWSSADTGGDEKKEPKSNDVKLASSLPSVAAPFRTFAGLEAASSEIIPESFPLFEEGIILSSDPIDSAQYYIARAQAVLGEIRAARKYIGYLDGESLQTLPVGIHKEINGQNYDIGIASIKLKPQYAELEVYMQFTVPQNGKVLTFRGKGIKFTKEGGIVGDATLELVADYAINLDGDKSQIILKSGSFVNFDCSGFQEMGLDAQVKFSRDLLVPEGEDGRILEGNVISSFNTKIKSWNDLVVQIDFPAFQVTKLEGVGFSVRNAVFDFSDMRNAPAVKFPEGYQSTQMLPDNPNLWRGFYLRELSVRLPSQFEKKEGGRTSFAAYDVIIDNMGFTGLIEGKNLIQRDQGDMNGWAFSLDSLGIALQANQIREAGFNGEIVVPIAKDETPFTYTAVINPGNAYLFNVSPTKDLQFEVFKTTKVDIYEASYLDINVIDGKFRPKANLHGKMSISAKMGDSESSKSVNLADITFEDLELQSVKPYVKVGAFSFGSEAAQQAMASLPISINNIGMQSLSDTEMGLDFDIMVNLTESFGGSAGLTIVGKIDSEKGYQSWRYKKISVNQIMIDVDQGAYKFYGKLTFFRNDATYGNGFNGMVDAEFNPGIKVKATAIFGSVSNMRYWYADAMAEFNNGIPIFTGVGIYGFGGGAYYRMKMDTEGAGSDLGKTASGVVYVPEPEAGLGLKATVAIGSHPSPAAFNGDATFEISFFKGGGVRYIAFSGNAYIMTPPIDDALGGLQEKVGKVASAASKLQSGAAGMLSDAVGGGTDNSAQQIYGEIGAAAGKRGQVSARMLVSYDFENKVLHGNFEMFVNVAGGIIKGVGSGGRAGWAVMHFAPQEWYVYIGTPDDRCGISAGVGPIRANLTSYFMVGTKILSSPPPPDIVSDILGGIDLDYMGDENALGEGKGFAFGAALDVDTGDLTFLMFYARFQAGLGFDIMLKNYGNVRCKGRTEPLGVNGWYANGQAYAYFDGSVGISVKLFGKRKKVEILNIGAAAVLQAKLPNPFWMRGIVGGRYRVLGGLVKGNCRFEVTIGEECEMIGGSVLDGIKVIADATPQNGEKDIDVFNAPQAVFNMEIMKNFSMIDVDDVKKTFRIKLDHFKLVSDGAVIPGEIEWNEDNTVAAFNSYDVFPSKKKIDLKIKVSFEEYTGGSWKQVIVDGKTYTEELNTSFESGIAPDYIPHKNIVYSYPVINQYNYYPQESNVGYLTLEKGQPYLFDVGTEWKQLGRFTGQDGSKTEFDITYNTGAREVNYSLPSSVKTNQIYAFELINTPAKAAGKVDRNVSAKGNKVEIGGESLDTEITTRKAEGTIEVLQEKAIFSSHIRSSQYATLSAKMDDVTDEFSWRRTIRNGVHELGRTIYSAEFFDVAEVSGINGQQPLIQFRAVLNDDYYTKFIHPLNYINYPLDGNITLTNRDPNVLGVPPVKALYLRQNPGPNALITTQDIASGTTSNLVTSAAFIYNLPHYYELDYLSLQGQVANRFASGTSNSRLNYLLTTPFPRIRSGSYNVEVQYVLPGKNKVISKKEMKILNPVQD